MTAENKYIVTQLVDHVLKKANAPHSRCRITATWWNHSGNRRSAEYAMAAINRNWICIIFYLILVILLKGYLKEPGNFEKSIFRNQEKSLSMNWAYAQYASYKYGTLGTSCFLRFTHMYRINQATGIGICFALGKHVKHNTQSIVGKCLLCS